MVKPTRWYSKNQESAVAKAVGGKRTANSGAMAFYKGDVSTDDFLIECKTVTKECKSFSIKKDWLIKNNEERFAMGKQYSAVAFDFGDAERYYIINEDLFKTLLELLKEEEK